MHMPPLRHGRARGALAVALGTALAASLAAFVPATQARVTKIVIDSTQSPAYGGATFGSVGQYEIVAGRAFGELDPTDPKNTIVQDLALAPKNANGKVEYISTFTIVKPIALANGNRVLIYNVVNRGGKIDPGGSTDGYSYLESGWQGDLLANCTTAYPCTSLSAPYTANSEVIQVPVAKNADGSPVTGPVLGRIINASGDAARQMIVYSKPVPYKPQSLDTSQATLTTYTSETITGVVSGVATIPASDWAWDNCTSWDAHLATPNPDPTSICVKGGFNPSLAYNLVFTAKDPLVQGTGFAATRDIIAFFKHAAADDGGTANPLAGGISYAISRGTSQSGNFIKSLIHLGFNQDETGAIVMDGAWPHIAARQNPLNFRFALPDGAATLYEPGSEPVLWYAHYPDTQRSRTTAGILDRCTASNTCPKIIDTFGGTEHWDLRASPYTVGTSDSSDIPLPRNVRRYFMPGTTHGGGAGGFTYTELPAPAGGCTLPSNPNPESDTLNALLVAMNAWVTKGTLPPASRYPTLSGHALVQPTKAAMGFPTIPLYALPASIPTGLNNSLLDYDFGPQFIYNDLSGVITQQPPAIKQVITMLVPKVNADGNEDVAGQSVPSVLFQAPLGTYLGWNITASGYRAGTICAFTGGYVPFAQTKATRIANGDPRLSLDERYGTHAAYVTAVTTAANTAVAQRFLLQADADKLISQATASNVCNAPGGDGTCH